MSRDDAYLFDMLESAQAILDYLAGKRGMSFQKTRFCKMQLCDDWKLSVRRLGESQRKLRRNIHIFHGWQ